MVQGARTPLSGRQGAAGRRGLLPPSLATATSQQEPLASAPLPWSCLQPNVTAQDGPHPFLERVGGGAAAAAAAGAASAAASAATGGAAASVGAAAAAAALPTPSWLPAGTFSGDGTAFSEAVPGTGAGFACSYRYLNPYFSTHFAAINKPMVGAAWAAWTVPVAHGGGGLGGSAHAGWGRGIAPSPPHPPAHATPLPCLPCPARLQWDEGAACGRCITAWCVDDRRPVQGKKVTVMVTDLCPECKEGEPDAGGSGHPEGGGFSGRGAVELGWLAAPAVQLGLPAAQPSQPLRHPFAGRLGLPSAHQSPPDHSLPCPPPPPATAGDVDFSIPVYREITGMWPHRLRVQWEWADCSPMVDGNILLTPKVCVWGWGLREGFRGEGGEGGANSRPGQRPGDSVTFCAAACVQRAARACPPPNPAT